jgi:hypothetical protein
VLQIKRTEQKILQHEFGNSAEMVRYIIMSIGTLQRKSDIYNAYGFEDGARGD